MCRGSALGAIRCQSEAGSSPVSSGRRGAHTLTADLSATQTVRRPPWGRSLRVTLLAPDIVEAILDGRQPEGLRLEDLLKGFPLEWERR